MSASATETNSNIIFICICVGYELFRVELHETFKQLPRN